MVSGRGHTHTHTHQNIAFCGHTNHIINTTFSQTSPFFEMIEVNLIASSIYHNNIQCLYTKKEGVGENESTHFPSFFPSLLKLEDDLITDNVINIQTYAHTNLHAYI